MKIYTRRGDGGETDLFGGPRVGKEHPRVVAYGALDEVNAVLGTAAAQTTHDDIRGLAQKIQGELFDHGAYLATPDPERRRKSRVPEPSDEDIAALETWIDTLEKELEPLRRFVLPGGTLASAAFHVARTVCRRAERTVLELHREEPLDEALLRYVNRLSDLLFVIARVENHRAGVPDIEWEGRSA